MQRIRSYEKKGGGFDLGMAMRPCLGESVSGDLIWSRVQGDQLQAVLIDALGHGREAYDAAKSIEIALGRSTTGSLDDVVDTMHRSAKGGRGAAASVIHLDLVSGGLESATIGNTTVRVVGSSGRSDALAANGVIGQSIRKPIPFAATLSPGDVVLAFSDGVASSIDETLYARLSRMGAQSAARLLVRRYGKTMDDASALVLRRI